MTHPFPYGQTELQYLAQADADLARLFAYYDARGERPERPVDEDPFVSLIHAINDQLISLKAAASIWGRLTAAFGDPPTAAALAAATPADIRACGTTLKKAEYMHDIATAVLEGRLDLETLRHAPDEELIATLTGLRGIGRWTAEMLMIHTYERPDVVSYGDAAIRRGICMLKGLEADALTPARFRDIIAPWSPYGTTASIYLWRLSKEEGWPEAEA